MASRPKSSRRHRSGSFACAEGVGVGPHSSSATPRAGRSGSRRRSDRSLTRWQTGANTADAKAAVVLAAVAVGDAIAGRSAIRVRWHAWQAIAPGFVHRILEHANARRRTDLGTAVSRRRAELLAGSRCAVCPQRRVTALPCSAEESGVVFRLWLGDFALYPRAVLIEKRILIVSAFGT
jgi:hypothetical protein